ncbi:replication endonuclease [Marinomonas sp.]|uniref:replication endonuclease n=1 Tax=Marinomonas sp. TaxID=1904862 RepID=UPI003F987289
MINLKQRENLIIRIKAMEEEAKQLGQSITFFCAYQSNQEFQPVKEIAKSFSETFHLVRAKLKRFGIEASGIKVTEPMKNGDPKFFIVLFSDPKNDQDIAEIINHYLSDSGFSFKSTSSPITESPQTKPFIDKRLAENSNLDKILCWSKAHQIRLVTFFGQTKTAN